MPLVRIHVCKGAASTNLRRCSTSPTMSLSKRSAFRAESDIGGAREIASSSP